MHSLGGVLLGRKNPPLKHIEDNPRPAFGWIKQHSSIDTSSITVPEELSITLSTVDVRMRPFGELG